jgi:hypothetical protein
LLFFNSWNTTTTTSFDILSNSLVSHTRNRGGHLDELPKPQFRRRVSQERGINKIKYVFPFLMLFIQLQLTHQPTYALNKMHSEAIIKLRHVSAPGCHHQGVIQSKGVQGQHAHNT